MEHYVGLDVSLKSTAICIVDAKGKSVREGAVVTDPETIARPMPCGSDWRVERPRLGFGPS